jgi:GDPmannose 4,6-dehydratase
MRPAEVAVLCGDSTKAREVLGWHPRTSFEEMVSRMVANDIDLLS